MSKRRAEQRMRGQHVGIGQDDDSHLEACGLDTARGLLNAVRLSAILWLVLLAAWLIFR
jgi:hypothetical protein